MRIDYEKLTKDLIRAKEASVEAAKGEDGGSANLDSLTIRIPRARESKVIEAVKNAGLYTRGRREWIGSRYFISAPTGGQGNSNYRAVQAMDKVMSEAGWDTLVFYKMD